MIELKGIYKSFRNKAVLKNINLSIAKGECVGIAGPNGSGKSTLLNIITGCLRPDAGEVIKSKSFSVGYSMELPSFPNQYECEKILKIFSLLKDTDFSLVDTLLAKVGIPDQKKTRFKALSNGMKRRLSIAIALLNEQDFLILDEPYNGMDPQGFFFLRGLVTELKSTGRTILITSHLLNELEIYCDKVLFMNFNDTPVMNTTSKYLSKYGSLEMAFKSIYSQ